MSALSDSLSILNVEQLNNAVNLAQVLPLQTDANQTNQLSLPIQNAGHTLPLSTSHPQATLNSTISPTLTRNVINSGQLPILMQLNTIPNQDQTSNAIRQITIPILQDHNSQVLLPIQNITPTLGTCSIQPNNLTAEHNTDLHALLSSPNQFSSLNLNQIIDQRMNDSSRIGTLTSLPITMTTQTVVANLNQTETNESTKLSHSNKTFLINFKLPLTSQTNQHVKVNTVPTLESTSLPNVAIGQQLQQSLSDRQKHPIQKPNLSSLATSSLNDLLTQTNGIADTEQEMLQDPVAAASLFAGLTNGLQESAVDSQIMSLFETGLWCADCNESHPFKCPVKGDLHSISDSPIVSHARQTLPNVLQIKSSTVSANTEGVFARETIVARSQFGPLKGNITKEADIETDLDCPNHWKIFQNNEVHHCIEAIDESVCNWTMFVRNARMHAEQNLVAYQWGQHIFFTTLREIQPGEELLYWYSEVYAKKKGLKGKPEDCFWCTKCNRQFLSALKLKSHMKYSHPDMSDRKFKCIHCSRAFLCMTKLNVHQMTHSNIKPHKCNICEKTFTDPSNLRMHQLIHSGEKNFKCPQCDKGFRQKAHLVTHMVTHTGEKKLKCPQCDKLFSRQSDVKTHMYFHTKEKLVKCSLCFKEFWNPQHYRKHMKSHAKVREYTCSYCKREFNMLTHLKRHQESRICQQNPTTEEGESAKLQLTRRRGRPKSKKKTDLDTTLQLIAPADTPVLQLPVIEGLATLEPVHTDVLNTESLDSLCIPKKRSKRISQRRREGKVKTYTEDSVQNSPDRNVNL